LPVNPFSDNFTTDDGGAGDADFLVTIGKVNGDTAGTEGEGLLVGLDGVVDGGVEEDVSVLDDAAAAAGMSNSAGRTRGVACTLVISLARSQ